MTEEPIKLIGKSKVMHYDFQIYKVCQPFFGVVGYDQSTFYTLFILRSVPHRKTASGIRLV